MNTRLQVEHPVTEMITGARPGRMAAARRGRRAAAAARRTSSRSTATRSRRASTPRTRSAASCRRSGTLAHLRAPPPRTPTCASTPACAAATRSRRYYDPMIAKLIVHGDDRARRCARLAEALAQYEIVGVATNVALPAAPDRASRRSRRRRARHRPDRAPPRRAVPAADAAVDRRRCSLRRWPRCSRVGAHARQPPRASSADPHSPWHASRRLVARTASRHRAGLRCADGDARYPVSVRRCRRRRRVIVDAALATPDVAAIGRARGDGSPASDIAGGTCAADRRAAGERAARVLRRRSAPLAPASIRSRTPARSEAQGGHLTAPMSGTIVAVSGRARATRSRRGAPLMILEAMKMEHTIVAPDGGHRQRRPFPPGRPRARRRGPRSTSRADSATELESCLLQRRRQRCGMARRCWRARLRLASVHACRVSRRRDRAGAAAARRSTTRCCGSRRRSSSCARSHRSRRSSTSAPASTRCSRAGAAGGRAAWCGSRTPAWRSR